MTAHIIGRPGDGTRAIALLTAVGGDDSDVRFLQIPGSPASKARPRFGKGGRAYTSAESRAAERRTSAFLRQWFPEPMTGNVAMAVVFFRRDRQRIDADNMLKHVCDAANGILWVDDSQVTAVVGIVEHDSELPRTLIAVAPHESTMRRGTDDTMDCEHCGKPYQITSTRNRRFCSSECNYAARVNARELIDCAQCGKPFRRKTNRQIICSPECRVERMRNRNRSRGGPPSDCAECGKQLTHRRGGRCRDCWRKTPLAVPAQPPLPAPPITPTTTREATLL